MEDFFFMFVSHTFIAAELTFARLTIGAFQIRLVLGLAPTGFGMDRQSVYEDLGHRIRKTREERGLTQESLASLISLSRTSITNIERGRQSVPLHKLIEIADALRVDASNLLPRSADRQDVDIEGMLPQNLSREETSWIKTVVTSAHTKK